VSGQTGSTGERNERRLPDQVTMGLLPYLTAHAVDEDYAHAAARRAARREARREAPSAAHPRRRIGAAGAAALAVFAVLAVTAAAQTSQDSVSQERERRALVDQVKERKSTVDAERRTMTRLRAENDRLDSELLRNTEESGAVLAQRELLGLRSGTSAVHGPGVEIVVDDAVGAQSDRNRVLDSDLQRLVNGLWRAGAEAISINGQRLTALSAIRHAGTAITVNFTSLQRPYRILAIGNKETLPSSFADTTSGQAWFDLQREVGLRFKMTRQNSVRLPAAELHDLRYAETPGTSQEKRSQ
jgi:uncharacterized protein YlxW (UPF0749 family)